MKKRAWISRLPVVLALALCGCDGGGDSGPVKSAKGEPEDRVAKIIEELDRTCREQTVYMVGPEKGVRLAELIRSRAPEVVVECGTALGYSGLWIARELEKLGRGKLITIELDPARAELARENFRRAGLAARVDVRTGDARALAGEIEDEVDVLFLDCNYANYHPCFLAIEGRLKDGALLVADNVGIGAGGMQDYLDAVRSDHESETEWFDIDLPWGKRDAMELTTFRRKAGR